MWVVGVFFSVCWSLHTISDILVMALRYSLTTVNMLHRFSCVRMRVCPRCAYRTNCLDFWFKKLIMQAGCKLTHVASIPDFESGQAGSFPVLDRWHCPTTCLLKLLHLQHYVHATVLCLAFFFCLWKSVSKRFYSSHISSNSYVWKCGSKRFYSSRISSISYVWKSGSKRFYSSPISSNFFMSEKVAVKGSTVVLSIQTPLLCLTKSQNGTDCMVDYSR